MICILSFVSEPGDCMCLFLYSRFEQWTSTKYSFNTRAAPFSCYSTPLNSLTSWNWILDSVAYYLLGFDTVEPVLGTLYNRNPFLPARTPLLLCQVVQLSPSWLAGDFSSLIWCWLLIRNFLELVSRLIMDGLLKRIHPWTSMAVWLWSLPRSTEVTLHSSVKNSNRVGTYAESSPIPETNQPARNPHTSTWHRELQYISIYISTINH